MTDDQLDAMRYAVPSKPKARPWRTLAISLGLLALLPVTGLLWIMVLVVATILTVILSRTARLADRFLSWWMGRLVWYGTLTQRLVGKAPPSPPADTMKPVVLTDPARPGADQTVVAEVRRGGFDAQGRKVWDCPACGVEHSEEEPCPKGHPIPGRLMVFAPTPRGGH